MTFQAAPANKKGASAKPVTSAQVDGGREAKSLKKVGSEDFELLDMRLDEIESCIGSLIQADNISQLKRSSWKERLEGAGISSSTC